MVIFYDFPVVLQRALTFNIPFSSTSNVTSIYGTPLGAGVIPSKEN